MNFRNPESFRFRRTQKDQHKDTTKQVFKKEPTTQFLKNKFSVLEADLSTAKPSTENLTSDDIKSLQTYTGNFPLDWNRIARIKNKG